MLHGMMQHGSSLNRRCVLQTLAALGGAALLPAQSSHAEAPRPCAPRRWTKHGPLLKHTGEPQGGWIQNFTSTVEPLEANRWRIWGSVSGKEVPRNIGFAEGAIGELRWTFAELSADTPFADARLSLGNLPTGWQPVQPVYLKLHDGRHRLYFWAHGPGIVRYLAADSEDGRRFRVVNPLRPCIYHPKDRAVDGAAALEIGLQRLAKKVAKPVPGEPLAPAALISNDATNVYQLPDGSFEMYTVGLAPVPPDSPQYFAEDNIPGLVRVIERLTSDDGLRWENRRRVIVPGKQDSSDQQFYYLSVTHTPRGRVGILGDYRLAAQTIDFQWCYSPEGIVWQRATAEPWLPRGDSHEPDSFILHAPHALVERDGVWHLFYTGGNFAHNHRRSFGPESRSICLATTDSIWAAD